MAVKEYPTPGICNGPAAAALLAGGIGAAVMGVITTLSAISTGISSALNLYNPVGPLSGKVLVAVVAYLLSWVILHFAWRNKDVNISTTTTLTFILLAIGLLGTFPPVFELLAGG